MGDIVKKIREIEVNGGIKKRIYFRKETLISR